MKIFATLMIMAALIIAGCQAPAQPAEQDDAIIKLRTYGAFSMPSHAEHQLTVEPGKVTYTIYSYDGNITLNRTKAITLEQYHRVTNTLRTADFSNLKDKYS